ncbi:MULTISPECIES: GNAT family N-acetyltransferase [unclassified Clostridium]|uniref:GNAT family N-acetyltransferase n=1 Tax=unclassified Clostridium TaxID=2614128 RepID=UPI0002975C1A|nr:MULTISPECIES: GNAT family N-acetyltransferase [unclassified Clostridium]EKQ57006.1 MAG: acetyltransferase [Clostridium sp. Maddingley MBC34-26]
MENRIDTRINNFKIRFAKEDDTKLILEFIRELADYEKLLSEVIATEEIIYDSLFIRKKAEVVIGEYDGKPVGFALFFHNFSTFLGKPGIYLEDLYIKPEFRKLGLGKIMLTFLGKLAIERDCGRLEWWCIDWNESAIDFYKKMGAKQMDEWTVYRVDNEVLSNLSNEF